MSGTNPLISPSGQQQPADTAPDPMLVHARIWRHAHSMDDDKLASATEQASYTVPLLGKLAGDPKTTGKDVIKAAASAAADLKVTPQEAVQFISQMPTDPDKLQPWLKGLYEAQMTQLVHMKAAAMLRADPQGAGKALIPGAAPQAAPVAQAAAATAPAPTGPAP
jgi:hypothetical protein